MANRTAPTPVPADDDLAFASVGTLSSLLRERTVRAVDLAGLYLDRLQTIGRRLNAVAEVTAELAFAQAKRADALLDAGTAPSPLTGIPYGAKDLLATSGIPTRWGSAAHRDQVFAYDATVVRRLAEAGAVLVAKLAMVQLAGAGGYDTPRASLHGPGLNPWNRKHWAGGSSSGSAAAVAAGLVPFALGSETWGSIVTPAAFCGVSGFRPTHGLVSLHGAMEISWHMDKIGPIARTAADCAAVLDAIAGPDPLDPVTDLVPEGPAGRPGTPVRLGVIGPPQERPARPLFERALNVLGDAGFELAAAALPAHPYAALAMSILNADFAAAHGPFLRSEALRRVVDPQQRAGMKAALTSPTAAEYAQALKDLLTVRKDALAVFERVDLLVAPTLDIEAPSLTAKLREVWGSAGGMSVLGSLFGLPEISVPMGFGPQGLPIGLSFVGPPRGDELVLKVAAAFQAQTDWHLRRPRGSH